MWIAAKALNLSPFDERISNLSLAQLYWVILNYQKDREEDFEKYKFLAYVTNPEIARKLLEKDPEIEESSSDEDEWLKEVASHSKEGWTPEKLQERLSNIESGESADLDIIERIEE